MVEGDDPAGPVLARNGTNEQCIAPVELALGHARSVGPAREPFLCNFSRSRHRRSLRTGGGLCHAAFAKGRMDEWASGHPGTIGLTGLGRTIGSAMGSLNSTS